MQFCCIELFKPWAGASIGASPQVKGRPEAVAAPVECKKMPKYLQKIYDPPCILSGSLSRFVELPPQVERNEWLATHAYEFFHLTNAYYGSIASSCNLETCPIMRVRQGDQLTALIWPPDFIATAKEGHSSRNSMTTLFFSASNTLIKEICASNYIDSALTWIETQLECPDRFPKAMSDTYRADFEARLIQPVFQLLYHALAHIYEAHYEDVEGLEEEAHLNGLLCHFIAFSREFGLLKGIEYEDSMGRFVDRLFPREIEELQPVNLAVRRLSSEPASA